MRPIYVRGAGLWAPGFADVSAWRSGSADPSVERPRCAIVDARLKRGSSRFANMLGEVTEQAASQAGLDLKTVPTVYGSSLGEIETMVMLLRMLYEEEGKLSPNRFKNSVHNAVSGLVSIAAGNTAFSTAIAGGDRSFETSLLEAWAYLEVEGGSIVLAVGDDRPPVPLDQLGGHDALALGFALSVEPPSEGPRARLSDLRRSAQTLEGQASVPATLAKNCAAAGLELLDAVLARRSGVVPFALPGHAGLCADLDVEP
jgi:hypothetical protein